jgi:hypothetical protein
MIRTQITRRGFVSMLASVPLISLAASKIFVPSREIAIASTIAGVNEPDGWPTLEDIQRQMIEDWEKAMPGIATHIGSVNRALTDTFAQTIYSHQCTMRHLIEQTYERRK